MAAYKRRFFDTFLYQGKGSDPEIRHYSLTTLGNDRYLSVAALFWSQSGWACAIILSGWLWLLVFPLCDVALFAARWRLGIGRQSPETEREPATGLKFVAIVTAQMLLVAINVAVLCSTPDDRAAIMAIIIAIGFAGYTVSVMAIFPVLALSCMLMILSSLTIGLGFGASDLARPLTVLIPFGAVAYWMLILHTHDSVLGNIRGRHASQQLSLRDALTELPNRRALYDRMDRDFRPKLRFKLLLIDLDHFKIVNDTHGHGIGDALLVEVANRLTHLLGPDKFVARLGGDELAMLVYGDNVQATAIARDVIQALSRPYAVENLSLSIGCSIGMCCTDDACNRTELMQYADVALYEAKRRGRGQLVCYEDEMARSVSERLRLVADMDGAVERGEMYLLFQPIMALTDEEVTGYEALIRWHHPVLGPIFPSTFIPAAEESGQIVEIGAWVLEAACREIAKLPGEPFVAVNVSAVQFRSPQLLRHIKRALSRSGIDSRRLEIELTETAIVEDGGRIAEVLAAIRRIGVSVALDDFGTGYSSLSHLRDFPLDLIKVDRSFVSRLETDFRSRAVMGGIMHLARELRIAVTGEGVETKSQLDLLCEMGCDSGQGYFIGRPGPLEIEELRRAAGAA